MNKMDHNMNDIIKSLAKKVIIEANEDDNRRDYLKHLITTCAGRRICRYIVIPKKKEELANKLKSGIWLVKCANRLLPFEDHPVEVKDMKDTQDYCDDDKIIPGVNVTYDQQEYNLKPIYKETKVYTGSKYVTICPDLQDKYTENPSGVCGRTLLRSVCDEAAKNGFTFGVGFEIEFNLTQTIDGKEVPVSRGGGYCHTLNFVDRKVYKCLSQMISDLNRMGIEVNQFNSESSLGQFKFALMWSSDPVETCDNLQVTKECIMSVASCHGMNASFMPKFNANSDGNSQHCHISLWKNGKNLFKETKLDYDLENRKYRNVDFDENVEGFIGEILENLQAIVRLTAGSHNSLKRFVPGTFAGRHTCWGIDNKEAPLRLVTTLLSEGCHAIEMKLFDSFNNPYIGLAGILAVGLDGILKKSKLSRDKWVQGLPAKEISDDDRKSRGIDEMPSTWPELEKYEFSGLAKKLMDNEGVKFALGCMKEGWEFLEANMPTVELGYDLLRDKF